MRYLFSEHPEKEGWYRVCDTLWQIVCDFKAHQFNDTQVFHGSGLLPKDANVIATVLRELGDWLEENHRNEVFP